MSDLPSPQENAHARTKAFRLQEEVARLKAEVERLDTLCKQLSKQHSDISCENIMLRKAGDAVCESPYLWENDPAVIAWRAAKEGKPSV